MAEAEEDMKGSVEQLKGRAKEAFGALAGQDSTQREGREQQDKGAAQQEYAQKQAEAEYARRKAAGHEDREQQEQS